MISKQLNKYLSLECVCGGKAQYLLNWAYSGLNDSIFNYIAIFYECKNCGLVYNSNITDKILAQFYKDECSYFEKTHFDISAPENITKFECYFHILNKASLHNQTILDVGCGRGGFLLWLKKNGWKSKCQGVDIDLKSIPIKEKNSGVEFKEGNVCQLPYSDSSQSLLTYFHVFEHIISLHKILKEAHRVLNDNGYIMIEIPDAEQYKNFPLGMTFWFSIREHVNHFSKAAICNLMNRYEFNVISVNQNILPTPEFSYPSLIILAQKNNKKIQKKWDNKGSIGKFARNSLKALYKKAKKVENIQKQFSEVTFWGCSSELFSLLPLIKGNKFNICDSSKRKQDCYCNGVQIQSPYKMSKNGALIIVSCLHGHIIEKDALKYGWDKAAIIRL